MQGRLLHRVALVTGAASGIGRGIALQLAREGAVVSVVDMNLDGAKTVAKEIEASGGKPLAIQCDVSEEEQAKRAVKETVEQLGTVGILVNCAGVAGAAFLADMETAEWRRIFAVHCDGTFFFTRAVL
ncbi:MAG: SDR family NAD(P)-dependent oxidoreductase, partial [Dehalococcoidia bacterium]